MRVLFTVSMKPTLPRPNLNLYRDSCQKLVGILVVSHKRRSWIAIIAAISVCLWPRTVWCQYAPTSGPYKVLTVDNIVLHDPARDKNIPIKIYYPSAVGQFPVIIFSHGATASKDAYSALGQYWASYRYVSIHPSHADSVADCGFHGTLRRATSDPRGWENRPEDVSFIIDSLVPVENFAPRLMGKLDLRHIGVGGHPFGAYTAGLIGGTTILAAEKGGPQSFADKRVSAVVLGFAGLFRDGGYGDEVLQCTKLETLAFWDAYLKQDPKAKQYVASHGLQKLSGDAARFANK
jgi:hypothetical protein